MSAVKVTHSCPLGCWVCTCPGQPPSHHATELDAKRRRHLIHKPRLGLQILIKRT